MNLIDNLIQPEKQINTTPHLSAGDHIIDWSMAINPGNIITDTNRYGTLTANATSSISRNELSDETINRIAERVYELIRQRGLE